MQEAGTSVHWAEPSEMNTDLRDVPWQPHPPSSLPGLGFVLFPRKGNKMGLTQDTPGPWPLPRQVGGQGHKSALGTCPESGDWRGSVLSTCASPSPLSSLTPLSSLGLGPHPHCRESLALCPQRLAVAAAEDSRGCAKARGSTVVPASAQGLGCLQSAGKWGWGRSWWPPHPKDRPVTGTRPVLAASHARLLTGDTDPGSCIRCSACPDGPGSTWLRRKPGMELGIVAAT